MILPAYQGFIFLLLNVALSALAISIINSKLLSILNYFESSTSSCIDPHRGRCNPHSPPPGRTSFHEDATGIPGEGPEEGEAIPAHRTNGTDAKTSKLVHKGSAGGKSGPRKVGRFARFHGKRHGDGAGGYVRN